jgi:hypothetical protein
MEKFPIHFCLVYLKNNIYVLILIKHFLSFKTAVILLKFLRRTN